MKTGPRGRAVVTGGPRAASHATVILTAMLGFAVETGRLASNPAEGLSKIKLKSRERFLSEQEVVAIAEGLAVMEAAGELSRTMADALRLLLLTERSQDGGAEPRMAMGGLRPCLSAVTGQQDGCEGDPPSRSGHGAALRSAARVGGYLRVPGRVRRGLQRRAPEGVGPGKKPGPA